MTKIPCEVIKDLLPLYIDGLTSEMTDLLIREHTDTCEDCRSVLQSMKDSAGEEDFPDAEKEKKQIDFLKKNRSRNIRIVIFSLLGALFILMGSVLASIFLIGKKSTSDAVSYKYNVDGQQLQVTAVPMEGNDAVSKISITEEDGVIRINSRLVTKSPIYSGEKKASYQADQEIHQVWTDGIICWEDGTEITRRCAQIFNTAHEHFDDEAANRRTLEAVELEKLIGPYTLSFEQVREEDRGWVITTERRLNEKDFSFELQLAAFECLAVVEDLDYIVINNTWFGAIHATEHLGYDVKICGKKVKCLREMEIMCDEWIKSEKALEGEDDV